MNWILLELRNELMQLYIWSRASFFVGNLSGGTIPPSLFGTPIVWIDAHPTVHRRPASQQDTIIPKRIFDLKKQKFLSLMKRIPKNTLCVSQKVSFWQKLLDIKLYLQI